MHKTLKTVVGIIATAVITKATESLFDVSIFKPIFLTLWGWVQGLGDWLGSDVALPVWVVLLLSLMAVLLTVFAGVLVYVRWLEKRGETPKGAPLTQDQLNYRHRQGISGRSLLGA